MENDLPEEENSRKISDVLRNLSVKGGPFSISIAKIVGLSRSIPSGTDYHFYNNFPEFKSPIDAIRTKSTVILDTIGESDCIIGKRIAFPDDKGIEVDDDLAFDFLENVNDGIIEKVDGSFDDFDRVRKVEEESGLRMMRADGSGGDENGFQMVLGKKSKKLMERGLEEGLRSGGQEAKVAVKVKAKVPFHVPTIPRPQDEYKIIVNNMNQPFEHVWLQRSEDGSRFIHPLEKLYVLDFIDTSDSTSEPVKPSPLEETPFKLVEELKDLKQLVNKLRSVDEFAVDLEHNQYRSFQGLTCLMQISTRTEDFIIDTLKLRIQIGPHLRDLFKDPTKRKVMHGADRDIVWLQRDFGIYVCNMFDTGQASRVLKMERFSLEHLLHYFCGVAANKEYQNADWRIRPLPQEMIKYAREDTHYLLYIYDLMRKRLLMASAESESSDPPLVGVYKRSYEICSQLYEKELLTESSYLYVYGVQGAELNAQQLAVLSGLCEWRDAVARSEDESTGYVLPNRTLIEIAKEMPLTTNKLCRVLKSKHPYIERNLGSVVSIIRHSIQNTAAFEEAAKYLKERRLKIANEENTLATEESEALPSEAPEILQNADGNDNVQNSTSPNDRAFEKKFNSSPMENEIEKSETDGLSASVQRETLLVPEHPKHINTNMISSHSAEVTVQTIKKPTRAFGALFGNSAKRKFGPDKKEQEDNKLEQIKSTVSLPFHKFSGKDEQLQRDVKKSDEEMLEVSHKDVSAPGSSVEDVIVLEDDSDTEESAKCDIEEGDEPMSLSDLSSSFEKCLPSVDQTMSSKQDEKSQQSEGLLQIKPFDYEAARMQVKFKGDAGAGKKEESDGNNARSRVNRKKGSVTGPDEGATEFGQGRRRQAFPASGNRSATFR